MCHFFLSIIISHSHLSVSLPKSNHLASPRSLSLLAGLHAPATDDSAAPIPRRSAVLFLAGARQLLLSSRSPLVTPPHTRRMQTEADHGAKPEPADVTSDAKPRVEDLVREVVAWEDLTTMRRAVEFGDEEGEDPTVGSSLKHGEEAIVQRFNKKRGTITIFMTNNISFILTNDVFI